MFVNDNFYANNSQYLKLSVSPYVYNKSGVLTSQVLLCILIHVSDWIAEERVVIKYNRKCYK